MGYGKVFALSGGWDEWVRLGYPVVRNVDELDALVGKVVEAYGGVEALRKAPAIRHTGKVTSLLRGGAVGEIVREFERPERLHVIIRYGTDTERRVYDGKTGWRDGRVVTGPPLDAMILQAARMGLPLVLRDRKGELADRGTSLEGGIELRTVELPLGNGLTLTVDIDPASGRIVRSTGRGGAGPGGRPLEFITRYSDYREVDGIVCPFREGNFANGFATGDTVLSKVELLGSLPQGTFRP